MSKEVYKSDYNFQVFDKTKIDATKENMFLGHNVNVARYDRQKYVIFEKLTEKQLSFFWRPEEIDISKDRIDFAKLPLNEQHIFLSNLKYQTLLDSVQGRSPNIALLPIVSLPELETWIETWSFSETIHSRSYTHIIRNIIDDPSEVFDNIVDNEAIIKRADAVSKYYDELIVATQRYYLHGSNPKMNCIGLDPHELKKKIYLCLMSVNVLEAIRFYVSFACSFAFAERELMEGNGKIIRLIARDEQLHLTGTQHMLNILASGQDDEEFKEIAEECKEEVIEIFKDAAEQEKDWARYLFKGGSMLGLNYTILSQYIEYLTNIRTQAIGLPILFPEINQNPLPWMTNWLNSDNVQVAPQETEITSYVVGQCDSNLDLDEIRDNFGGDL